MIIKTVGISAGDGSRITSYAVTQATNERLQVLHDDNDQLLVADDFAQAKGRKHGLLHITINPDQAMADDELKRAIEAINQEFGFNKSDPYTLSMHQSKRADGSTNKHYHLVRPAADSKSDMTYKLFRSKGKDEAVSRLMEFELGHTLISGASNAFAEKRLRELGRDDYADQLAAAFRNEIRPRAAYSHGEHQKAKRNNFDLPKLRQSLKELAELNRSEQPKALAELINWQGLKLTDAAQEGRGRSRIMIETPAGVKDHNANRTLKIKASDVATFIEEAKEHLDDLISKSVTESRYDNTRSTDADYQRAGADSSEQQRNDKAPESFARHHESYSQDCSEGLTDEAAELAQAVADTKAQVAKFAANRVSDLSVSDLDAPPDLNDPKLLIKLARMLRKQLNKVAEALKVKSRIPQIKFPRFS